MPTVTIGERLLVHVAAFSRYAEAFECPPDVTQEGIARALGISRAHAALELKRLRGGGFVSERISHVTAGRVRRKVYFPTRTGEERARSMREYAKQKPLVLVDGGQRREALGAEVVAALKAIGLRESDAYGRVLVADVVDLAAARPVAPAPTVSAPPFLGRDRELDEVRAWLNRPGSPLLAILGVAGIGKTALAERLATTIEVPSVLRKAYAFETARTVAHAIAEFLAAHARPRLRNHLAAGSFDAAQMGAILAHDLRGVLVAVDDADRSPEVCAFLEMTAEAAPDAKLLVTARSRPRAYDARDLAEGRASELLLGGLDRSNAAALAKRLGLPSDPASRDRMYELTQGHPLAIALLASAGLESSGRARRFLEDAVLEGIDDRSATALQTFAILRRPIPDPEALRLPGRTARTLARRGLLSEHRDGFALHDLARDALLGRATAADLRAAHARAARYWARRSEALESAHHAIEAGRIDAALEVLAPVAMRFAESPDAAEFVTVVERIPEPRRPLLPLARALEFLGRWSEARPQYAAVAEHPGEESIEARLGLGRIASKEGRYADAERHFRDALAAAHEGRIRGRAERLLAIVLRKRGAYAEAHGLLDRAFADLNDDPVERARVGIDRAALLFDEKRYAEALAGLADMNADDLPPREAASLETNRAVNLAGLGRRAEAVDAFRRAASRWRDAGDARGAAYAEANAADALLELGRIEEAREALDAAARDAGATGDRVLASMIEANLGKALARSGDRRAAEERMLRSVALLEDVGNPRSFRERCLELAQFYSDGGDVGAAAEWRARADRATGDASEPR